MAARKGHYFLSRPRRFGKSLFIDTLKELFEGNEALFAGIPHDLYRNNAIAEYEGHYAAIVYACLMGTGKECRSTSSGWSSTPSGAISCRSRSPRPERPDGPAARMRRTCARASSSARPPGRVRSAGANRIHCPASFLRVRAADGRR